MNLYELLTNKQDIAQAIQDVQQTAIFKKVTRYVNFGPTSRQLTTGIREALYECQTELIEAGLDDYAHL